MPRTKVSSNLEELASIIGTFQGVSEAAQDERFINQILMKANERTLEKFNKKAAERSAAVKNLNRNFNHMYEYGVAGITPGTVAITDPTSQAARLWVFKSIGRGRTINTFVTFRDAVQPNPLPSQRRDLKKFKVPDEVVSRMSKRKYVFRRRAEMTEYGQSVSIVPVKAKGLIFPSREDERGYNFWNKSRGPMEHSLNGETKNGASKHKMAFTNYFMAWWDTEGTNAVRQSAFQSIAARIGAAQRARAKENALKPAQATNIKGATAKAKKAAKKRMMQEATGE